MLFSKAVNLDCRTCLHDQMMNDSIFQRKKYFDAIRWLSLICTMNYEQNTNQTNVRPKDKHKRA